MESLKDLGKILTTAIIILCTGMLLVVGTCALLKTAKWSIKVLHLDVME